MEKLPLFRCRHTEINLTECTMARRPISVSAQRWWCRLRLDSMMIDLVRQSSFPFQWNIASRWPPCPSQQPHVHRSERQIQSSFGVSSVLNLADVAYDVDMDISLPCIRLCFRIPDTQTHAVSDTKRDLFCTNELMVTQATSMCQIPLPLVHNILWENQCKCSSFPSLSCADTGNCPWRTCPANRIDTLASWTASHCARVNNYPDPCRLLSNIWKRNDDRNVGHEWQSMDGTYFWQMSTCFGSCTLAHLLRSNAAHLPNLR